MIEGVKNGLIETGTSNERRVTNRQQRRSSIQASGSSISGDGFAKPHQRDHVVDLYVATVNDHVVFRQRREQERGDRTSSHAGLAASTFFVEGMQISHCPFRVATHESQLARRCSPSLWLVSGSSCADHAVACASS